jgi:hypothetical protein
MKHNRIALLLLAAMLTSLASCGGDTSAPSGDTTASAGDGTTAAEPSEYVNPGVDYKGETFTILDYQTEEYFWQAASYSDIHAEEEYGDPLNDAQFQRNRAVEEALNIKLDTYPVGGVGRGGLLVPRAAGNDIEHRERIFPYDFALCVFRPAIRSNADRQRKKRNRHR